MPELPEVEAVRREIAPAMEGARFERVLLRRSNLRIPFPRNFAGRLKGQSVRALTRRGKYLLAELSSGDTLIIHLGMSGSFDVSRGAEEGALQRAPQRHDHVVFRMSSGATVTFNDPRRFGLMDLAACGELERYPALSAMGPEPLSAAFDAESLARACRGKKVPLKLALLDQRVIAGLGNIYASEALHRARLSPRRRASTIATSTGTPREASRRLAAAIKAVLNEAIKRTNSDSYRSSRFRVYERVGARCRTSRCAGTITRIVQAGRSTFYCPTCQR
jgi:formamidopyrimidine-DNA glycosylase